ncbi:MAG: hypothetical protein ABUT39_17565 [Acidobacteriota bacterium]
MRFGQRTGGPLWDLRPFERKVHSQFGEDGVLEYLLALVQPVPRFAVEIGVWDAAPGAEPGSECNTRALLGRPDWTVLQMDAGAPADHPVIRSERVTRENLEELLGKYGVPPRPAVLGIDVDGVDYWLWDAVPASCRPRIVVIEYNGMYPDVDVARTVPYDPDFRWDGSAWSGASLGALVRLGRRKGYTLVHCTEPNAFFLDDELLEDHPVPAPQEIYSRKWGYLPRPVPDPAGRPWVDCGSELHLGRRLRFLWRQFRAGHR